MATSVWGNNMNTPKGDKGPNTACSNYVSFKGLKNARYLKVFF